jgi:recombinational DNA repair protein (RecF pathway)
MAYQTYTTQALVCGTFTRNTADGTFLLFTQSAGMLYADARSVREERSRQRGALQDFSLVKVSLVKGKAGWKVGSILPLKNYYYESVDQSARGSVVSVFRLLRRFFKGEEANEAIFEYVKASLDTLSLTVEHRLFQQMVVQVNILAELGYVDSALLPKALQLRTTNPKTIEYSPTHEALVESLYTTAVSVSHL